MKYMGSKNRIAKYIVPIIQDAINNNNISVFYDIFVGGANLIDKIYCPVKIGNDIHPQLIAMWNALQNGWIPPSHISEQEYRCVKDNKDSYPDYYVGYVGFCASFGARYFQGYARGFKNDGITKRDHSNESFRNIMKQVPNILDVKFVCGDYQDISIVNKSVIYCDPPYENTKKYLVKPFDYMVFWDWCRKQSENNIVFISGYDAPEDFKCIWQKEVSCNLDSLRDQNSNKKRIEKLFVIK